VYINFEDRDLIDVDEKSVKCIFPKFNRSRGQIAGVRLYDFYQLQDDLLEGLLNSDVDREKIQAVLREMVELKLCKRCRQYLWKNKKIEQKCIGEYVRKWSRQMEQKRKSATRPKAEGTQSDATRDGSSVLSETGNVDPDGAPIEQLQEEPCVPGAYRGTPPPESRLSVTHNGRCRSSRQQAGLIPVNGPANENTEDSCLSPTRAASHDPSNPRTPQTSPPLTPSPRRTGRSSAKAERLVPYETGKNPKTELRRRILQKLQKREIADGQIYVLHREDDEEYYKVGYTEEGTDIRLKGHNEKCNANWKVKLSMETKHAKRVENLIHLEFEVRQMRYQESWCKTGCTSDDRKCTQQHKEIIKTTLEEVEQCLLHWVTWMDDPENVKYRETSKPDTGVEWKLAYDYVIKSCIPNNNDPCCLMSTGESWVPPRVYQTASQRSASATTTPARPTLAGKREVQSDRPAERLTYMLGSDDETKPEAIHTKETLQTQDPADLEIKEPAHSE
jgi:hypothetical protein